MSNLPAVQTEKPQRALTVRDLVARSDYADRFKQVLGQRAPQFIASLISVANTMLDCEPKSVIASGVTAAALDLPVDKNLGFAWIVPYKGPDGKKMAQFQMGYKGFIQLALRTGQYRRMNARAINAEAFLGFDEVGEPKIDWSAIDETKDAAGYVVAWQLVNGFTKVCYWPKKRVETHAKRYSQSYSKGYKSPWTTHFDEMALKTVIKNELGHWGLMSIEMRRASQSDQAIIKDVTPEGEPVTDYPDAPGSDVPSAPKFETIDVPTKPVAQAAPAAPEDDVPLNAPTEPAQATQTAAAPAQPASQPAAPAAAPTPQPPSAPSPAADDIAKLRAAIGAMGITEDQLVRWAFRKFRLPPFKTLENMASIAPRKIVQTLENLQTFESEIKAS